MIHSTKSSKLRETFGRCISKGWCLFLLAWAFQTGSTLDGVRAATGSEHWILDSGGIHEGKFRAELSGNLESGLTASAWWRVDGEFPQTGSLGTLAIGFQRQQEDGPYPKIAHWIRGEGHYEYLDLVGVVELGYFQGIKIRRLVHEPDIRSNLDLTPGKWHHVAIVIGVAQVDLFIDGEMVSTMEIASGERGFGSSDRLAWIEAGDGRAGVSASVASVRVADKALDGTLIREQFLQGPPK